jgi:hypothetical protein
MPALGGIPSRLLVDIDGYLAVSPDGSRIAFMRYSAGESALMITNSDGSVIEAFKVPAFSPDGKLIACSVGTAESLNSRNTIVAVRIEDGVEMPLTAHTWSWTRWVEWLSDGSGLLITAREWPGVPDQIWHMKV